MALLTDEQRKNVWRALMRRWSDERASLSLLKAEIRDAVDAADQWVEDNAAAFNNALPTPARTTLTQAQKALLLVYVCQQRFGETPPNGGE